MVKINTSEQWWQVLNHCKNLSLHKYGDYGGSVFILRTPSMIDQIWIKCFRIRTIQENKEQKVSDSIDGEFIGIINYSIMGLIILENQPDENLSKEEFEKLYDEKTEKIHQLMMAKNHDYGEAWRKFGKTTFPDIILQKMLRMKSMVNNDGLKISEDLDANYHDIVNYSIFYLILEMERGKFEIHAKHEEK